MPSSSSLVDTMRLGRGFGFGFWFLVNIDWEMAPDDFANCELRLPAHQALSNSNRLLRTFPTFGLGG